MGGSESKVSQLNESINEISTDIIMNLGTSTAGNIKQTQSVVASGNSRVSNVTLFQEAKISLKTLSNSSVNAQLQTNLINQITAEANKTTSGMPEITKNKSQTDIKNIVTNRVKTNFSVTNLNSLSASIDQNQSVVGLDSSTIDTIKLSQSANAIGELTANMTSGIISDITANTSLSSKTTEVQQNPISSIIDSAGNVISGVLNSIGSFFGLDDTTVLLFIIMIVISGIISYKFINKMPADKIPDFNKVTDATAASIEKGSGSRMKLGAGENKRFAEIRRMAKLAPRRKIIRYKNG
jgi:phage shock protein PspC (stress-responsive transcriptional regulator)